MDFIRRNRWQLALLVVLLLLVGSILVNVSDKVEDKTSQIEKNQGNIAQNNAFIEKNCDLLAETNDAIREQFRLSMTDDIRRVKTFIESGGAATPAARKGLQASVNKNIRRRAKLGTDFPNLICP